MFRWRKDVLLKWTVPNADMRETFRRISLSEKIIAFARLVAIQGLKLAASLVVILWLISEYDGRFDFWNEVQKASVVDVIIIFLFVSAMLTTMNLIFRYFDRDTFWMLEQRMIHVSGGNLFRIWKNSFSITYAQIRDCKIVSKPFYDMSLRYLIVQTDKREQPAVIEIAENITSESIADILRTHRIPCHIE